MKTATLKCTALALALAACGARTLPLDQRRQDSAATTSASTTTASSSTGAGGDPSGASSAATGGGEAAVASSSSAGTGGAGGSPPAFAAKCSGTVDCPMLSGCAQWTYSVSDDGAASAAWASVTVEKPAPAPTCAASAHFSDADAGSPVSDVVDVLCGTMTWSLGLDRATMVVYVKVDPANLEWTPACN